MAPDDRGRGRPAQPHGRDADGRNADARDADVRDADLIALFLTGDVGAFETIVERHSRFAGAVAYAVTGDFHAAKDVVQEAFLRVHGGVGKLEDRERFRGWLRHVVRSVALDWRRRNKRGAAALAFDTVRDDAALDGDADGALLARDPIDERLDQEELRRRVREEVKNLPEGHREVVTLKYLEGLSYEEISAATGLSVATIESRLWRARNALRQRFERTLGEPQGKTDKTDTTETRQEKTR